MRKPSRTLLLIPLLLFTLACQTVMRPLLSTPTAIPTHPPIVSRTADVQPTRVTVSPTNTPATRKELQAQPTASAIPSSTPTDQAQPTPLSNQVQLSIFEDLWTTINDQYLYPDFNGQDWDAVYDEFSQRVDAGLSNSEFYEAMREMVDRLGDDHSVYFDPQETAEEDAEYAGNTSYVGIGAMVSAVPEKQAAVILLVFAGSPAEQAGLQSRDSILSANGESVLDEDGYLKNIILGPEGTQVTIRVQTPGEQPRELTLTRRPISGPIPVPYAVVTSPQGLRIGYIFLASFSDSTIDEQVGDALRAMSQDAPLDGLIIDNRENTGGADTVLRPTLSYFTSGTLGYFTSREEERPLEIRTEDVNGSSALPLVVLVGKNTVSYGEVFAGVLKDTGRAYLIGETTDGNVETLWGFDFEDGSRAWIACESFRPKNHAEENWELTGIIPDQTVMGNFYDYPLEDDPAVLAALEYLDSR